MPSISRIVAPVDFSLPSAGAVRYARSLAATFGCELVLLHVLETTEFDFSPIHVSPLRLDELMAEKSRTAQGRLERFPDGESNGAKTRHLILKGDPAEKILECADSESASLIVMPTHGFDPILRSLIGSVASKVLYRADMPVLTSVHFDRDSTALFPPRHIVCGLDPGPLSESVLGWAAQLAHSFAAHLTVVHATEESAPPDWLVQMTNRARDQAAGPLQMQVLVAPGDPPSALRDTAKRLNAGLVVIGRGAYAGGPFGRLRAHAYAIVRASPCPVVSL